MKEAKYIKTIYLKLFRIRQFEKELFFSEDRRFLKNRLGCTPRLKICRLLNQCRLRCSPAERLSSLVHNKITKKPAHIYPFIGFSIYYLSMQ